MFRGFHCIPKRKLQAHSDGKIDGLILCHDMMGGYVEDSNVQGEVGAVKQRSYNYLYWEFVDIFIYFSHTRLTIPPVNRTNTAHRHGVRVLGTFITEWEAGANDNVLLLSEKTVVGKNGQKRKVFEYADKLVELCKYYRFDGWFLNLESDMLSVEASLKMVEFTQYFTEEMHRELPGSLVIWYDSLETSTGKVHHQSCLNEENAKYLDACDAIFTDYRKFAPFSLVYFCYDKKHDTRDVSMHQIGFRNICPFRCSMAKAGCAMFTPELTFGAWHFSWRWL